MGLHAKKRTTLMGFENIFRSRNITYIWSHLSRKDKAITKKGEYFTILY